MQLASPFSCALVLVVAALCFLGCRSTSGSAADLFGAWRVAAIGSDHAVADVEQTVEFAEPDGVRGHAGVNRFTGTFTLDGDQLRFGPLPTTRMAGAPHAMEQETRLLFALESVRSFAIEDGKLFLIDGGARRRVTLVPAAGS